MSRLRNSPRLHKGAIISMDDSKPVPTVIAFQYNPATMNRTLKPNMSSADSEGSKTEVLRIDRPPTETISLSAEFDAVDGLEASDPIASEMGIYPELSALETLLYPSADRIIDNLLLSALGALEVVPPMAPLTLFVWGPKRVLPVRITSMTIDETAYDERLNPIQAKVSLDLTVLSYADFCGTDPGGFIFLAHQAIKESMAGVGVARSSVSFF